MKSKRKTIFILIFLMLVIPIFNGCTQDWDKVLKFKGITMYENEVATTKLTKKTLYVYSTENKRFTSSIEILDDTVKSYKIQIRTHKEGKTQDTIVESICKKHQPGQTIETFQIDPNYLKENTALYLKYTFYNTEDCKSSISSKLPTINTSEITTFFNTGKLIDVVGKEEYCNVDANGLYKDLGGNVDLIARIAYSQVNYQLRGGNTNLNTCRVQYNDETSSGRGDDGNASTFYSKYGNGSTLEQAQFDFVKWVASKASVNYLSDNAIKTIDDVIKWAKAEGRYHDRYTSAWVEAGDLVVTTDENGNKNIGVLYEPALGIVRIISVLSTSDKHYDISTGNFDTNKAEYISLKDIFSTKQIFGIVGKQEYCNVKTSDGVEYYDNDYPAIDLLVKVAHSQIGYKPKENKENINKCVADYFEESDKAIYNKYGSSIDEKQSSFDFVKWSAKKSGIDFPNVNTMDELIEWAKKEGRYYDDNYSFWRVGKFKEMFEPLSGDLVIVVDGIIRDEKLIAKELQGVGIVTKPSNGKNATDIIRYTKNGVVYDKAFISSEFFISMRGIAYK